jgi:hypothetical protein
METLKLWKKLNGIVKSGKPMESARAMLENGQITLEEASWALAALALLPITMIEALEKNKT